MTQHFGAEIVNPFRGLDGRQSVFDRFRPLVEIHPAPTNHVQIRNLDVREAISAGKFDALTKVFTSPAHVASQVVGIAETADGPGFVAWRLRLAREGAGLFMLLETSFDVGEGKVDVASALVDLGQFPDQAAGSSGPFRFCQSRQGGIVAIDDPQDHGESDLTLHLLLSPFPRVGEHPHANNRFQKMADGLNVRGSVRGMPRRAPPVFGGLLVQACFA
jgi:hypothetical protein